MLQEAEHFVECRVVDESPLNFTLAIPIDQLGMRDESPFSRPQ